MDVNNEIVRNISKIILTLESIRNTISLANPITGAKQITSAKQISSPEQISTAYPISSAKQTAKKSRFTVRKVPQDELLKDEESDRQFMNEYLSAKQ